MAFTPQSEAGDSVITPHDIENITRKSGYEHVGRSTPNGKGLYYQGESNVGGGKRDDLPTWRGPTRKTPEKAAQDYCDYINGLPIAKKQKTLRSAGHKRAPRTPNHAGPTPVEQKIAAMEKELRGLKRLREKESEGRQGYVYCIAEDPRGTDAYPVSDPRAHVPGDKNYKRRIGARGVKIGHAVDPHKRIAELQTGNPRKLILLGYIPGTMEDEARIHQQFISDNVLAEWFRPTRSLLALFTK